MTESNCKAPRAVPFDLKFLHSVPLGDLCKSHVAQVSKPAISPTSKSAAREMAERRRIWKSAIQQTWKSALRCRRFAQLAFEVLAYSPLRMTGAKKLANARQTSDSSVEVREECENENSFR